MPNYRLHERIGYKVSLLSRLMEARLENMMADQGVTRLMWCVLSGVGLEDVNTPSSLAQYIGITRPAVSRLLRTMEHRGWLERAGHDADGRGIAVFLTDEGQRKLFACQPLVDELNAHFTDKISKQDLSRFCALVDRLTEDEKAPLTTL
ncbi:MAG: MarR family winged helix-turn-helix transcriptional regulator [Stappiaceae bacterium]